MKPILKSILLFFIFLIITQYPRDVYAGNAGGGELLYQWVHDSTYQIFYKFYRDCSGPAEPDSVVACYSNTCNSFSNSVILNKVYSVPNPNVQVPLYCPNVNTTCTLPGSNIPGFWEWWYSGFITLPSRCNHWTFSVSIYSRSTAISNLVNPNSRSLYTEATLDNFDAQGDTSPFFSVKPVYHMCTNIPFTTNDGAYDVNNDSLAFTLINPLTGSGCPALDTSISFQTATPAYNLSYVNGKSSTVQQYI